MTLETLWYTLVVIYFSWVTAVVTLVTVFAVKMFRKFRALRASMIEQHQQKRVKFDYSKLPRRKRR